MTTRFYLPRWDTTRTNAVSPAFGSEWEQTTNPLRASLPTTKSASGATPTSTTSTNNTKSGSTTDWDIMVFQFVSDTLDVAQTITGTFSGVIKAGETSAAADMSLQVVIQVVSQDGLTQRGELYTGHTAALNTTTGALGQEIGTTSSTRIIPAGTALGSVSASAGDRIVLEVGVRSHIAATGTAPFLLFGDLSSTGDYALTAGLTTTLIPWFELSQTVTFGTPTGSTLAVAGSATATPAASGDLTLTAAVAGSATATAAAAGSLGLVSPVTGAAVASASAAAVLTLTIAVSGAAATTPVAAGSLVETAAVSGAAVATASAAGSLGAFLALTGAASAAATALGSLVLVLAPGSTVVRPFAGTVARPGAGVVTRPYAGIVARP